MKIKHLLFVIAGSLMIRGNAYSQDKSFQLEGVWEVTSYKFFGISAMDDPIANEWLGKKAIIKEELYFQYHMIDTYKELFKDDSNCNFRIGQVRELVSAEEYASSCNTTMKDLDIKKEELLMIHTTCANTPFREIVVLSDMKIMISWDGVIFILTRRM